MLTFIAEYWLNFLFGIIALGATMAARHFRKLLHDGKTYQKTQEEEERDRKMQTALNDMKNEIKADIEVHRKENQVQNEKIDQLMRGILALWKKEFLNMGKELLAPDHYITNEEFLEFSQEHLVYNSLGGNHEGDELFNSVSIKYHSRLQH